MGFFTPLLNMDGCSSPCSFLGISIPRITTRAGAPHLWLEGLREPPLLEIPEVIAGIAGGLFPLKYGSTTHLGMVYTTYLW